MTDKIAKTIAVVAAGNYNDHSIHFLAALEQALQMRDKSDEMMCVEVVAVGEGELCEEVVREALFRGADRGAIVCDKITTGVHINILMASVATALVRKGSYEAVICEPSEIISSRPRNALLTQRYKRAKMASNRSVNDPYDYLYDQRKHLIIPTLSAEQIGLTEEDLKANGHHAATENSFARSEGQTIVNLSETSDQVWADEVAELLLRYRPIRSPRPLRDARIVIGGGYGMGSEEGFEMLYTLASEVKGRVGATRAAIDADLCPAKLMIGPTGVRIRPKVYLACGISGQIQHLAGIDEHSTIISINTDIEAPINEVASYVIIGSVEETLPIIMEHYKQLYAAQQLR